MWGKPGRLDARETFLEGPNLLSKEPCQLWWQTKPSSDSHSAQQPQPLVVGWEHFPFNKLTMFPEIQVCAQTSIISFFFMQVISTFAWQSRSLANSAGFKRWVSLTWCICVLLGVATVWGVVRMRAVPPSRPGMDEINREWGKDSLAQECASSASWTSRHSCPNLSLLSHHEGLEFLGAK